MEITCTRRIEFDAGNRVMGHEGKCRHLHGHRYVAEFAACADRLDEIGRVIDFGVLKAKLGGWINEHWDHAFLVNEADEPLLEALFILDSPFYEIPGNPTAEVLAEYLCNTVAPHELKGTGVEVIHVRVWETPNCWADAHLWRGAAYRPPEDKA